MNEVGKTGAAPSQPGYDECSLASGDGHAPWVDAPVLALLRAARARGIVRLRNSSYYMCGSEMPDTGWWARASWDLRHGTPATGGPWSVEFVNYVCSLGLLGIDPAEGKFAAITKAGRDALKPKALNLPTEDTSNAGGGWRWVTSPFPPCRTQNSSMKRLCGRSIFAPQRAGPQPTSPPSSSPQSAGSARRAGFGVSTIHIRFGWTKAVKATPEQIDVITRGAIIQATALFNEGRIDLGRRMHDACAIMSEVCVRLSTDLANGSPPQGRAGSPTQDDPNDL